MRSSKTTCPMHQKTRRALLWMNLSHEPLIFVYTLLPFILRKDLQASLLQISILSALRPVIPIFSFYWSARLTNRSHRLRSNLMGAWALARLPFLFVPLFPSTWYLIFCCAMYELFNKSGIPALIEILKLNISKETRGKTHSFYYMLSFLESIVLGLLMAGLFDRFPSSWPLIYSLSALIGLTSLFLQLQVPIPQADHTSPPPSFSLRETLIRPWNEALLLLKAHPTFARFQAGFMIGGFGLMLIAPSLSIFYADYLQLDHSHLIVARSIFMGLGIVTTSSFWSHHLIRTNPLQQMRFVLLGFSLFPLLLLLSSFYRECFYLSFVLYGVAQAGSHLLWNLSGTLFATQEEDSSPFSRVNILMLGVRGAVAPALGGILCNFTGPKPLFLFTGILCLIGAFYRPLFQEKKLPLSP